MWNNELGKYMIDVSKYFLTAIFAMSLMKDLEDTRWLISNGKQWLRQNNML